MVGRRGKEGEGEGRREREREGGREAGRGMVLGRSGRGDGERRW